MRVSRRVRIRAVLVMDPRTEVVRVACLAAIRSYAQNVMQQEFREAVPFGPIERRATAVRTTRGSSEVKHGYASKCWNGARSIHLGFPFWS